MPRVALAGNNRAAVYALELLLEAVPPEDVLVIAPPPRELRSWQVSLAARAADAGVECIEPEDVNESAVAARIAAHDPAFLLSVYYTQLFRGALMDVIRGKAVNFHPSLLPRHRGSAPLIWAIVDGDSVTGLSVHHIDDGIDTGNLIVQSKLPINEHDTGFVLHEKMAHLVRATAAELLRDVLAGVPLPPGQQQTGTASYHSTRDPRVNHISWSDAGERVRNVVRALAPPLPGAFSLLEGDPVVLARVDPVETPPTALPKAPGMVEIGRDGVPLVWASDGAVRLTTVVVDGEAAPGSVLAESGKLVEGQVLD